jgi:hypothetical protein
MQRGSYPPLAGVGGGKKLMKTSGKVNEDHMYLPERPLISPPLQ